MSENIEDLRIDTTRIVSESFGEETAKLFRQYAVGKEAKELLFFLKGLLSEYLGEEKSAALADGLFMKYKMLRQ